MSHQNFRHQNVSHQNASHQNAIARNRRHRAGSRRGSVSSRRFVATFTGWTIVSMVTAAIRRHMVARSPATVDNIGRFIVNRPNTPIVIRIRQLKTQPDKRTVNVQTTKASANQRKSELFTWAPLYSQCPSIQAIRRVLPKGRRPPQPCRRGDQSAARPARGHRAPRPLQSS